LDVQQIFKPLRNYVIALASTAGALGASLLLRHYGLPHAFISVSFAVIALTFWYAGTGPGLLAVLLSCLEMSHFFVPLRMDAPSWESYFIIYGVFSALVGWFSASRYRAYQLLSEARENFELCVSQRTRELTHSNSELRNTQSELSREKDRLKVLLDFTNRLVSTVNIREALRTVLGTVRDITRSAFVGVGLPDPDGNPYPDKNEAGFDFVIADDSDETVLVAGEKPAARIFRAGTVTTNARNPAGRLTGAGSSLGQQFKTVHTLPLLGRDRALGILVVGRDEDKPYDPEDMSFLEQLSKQIGIAVENALAYRQITELTQKLSQENLYLENEIRSQANFEEIVGTSPGLQRILKLVETVALTDSTVLIYGETGTGKELVAQAIHNLSPRRDKTFVRLNCAAIPTGLLESELFGHERGAFTGAITQRIGRLELANHGTLFLDEIGEIPLELQPKLLRVLQEREFERLGSTRTLRTDVRLIAATNRNLQEMVEQQEFRADLFFRLNVFPIDLPPLRDRAEDIPMLVRHFAEELSRRMKKTIETIPSEAMKALCHYRWPGNIRELQNVIERAVILSSGTTLNVQIAELPQHTSHDESKATRHELRPARRKPVRNILAEVDKNEIIRVLKEVGGVIGGPNGAACRLNLKRTTLITRMKKLGIDVSVVSEPGDLDADTSDSSDTERMPDSQLN
jgi:formate hydrogenlyase transcriptional activator